MEGKVKESLIENMIKVGAILWMFGWLLLALCLVALFPIVVFHSTAINFVLLTGLFAISVGSIGVFIMLVGFLVEENPYIKK